MFDITSKRTVDTGTVELLNPDMTPMIGDGGRQCSIDVYGPGSSQYAKAEARRSQANVERMKRKGIKSLPTAEEAHALQAQFLADITRGLNNFTYPVEGDADDKKRFRALYMDRSLGYIAEQVQTYVGDWENFTRSSETSSNSSSEALPG